MAKPFSLSTKRHGGNFYVQFAFPDGGRSFQKSTGTSNRQEAEKIAMEWLVNGNIPGRINSKAPSESKINMEKLSFFNSLKTIPLDDIDADKVIKILKDRGLILSAIRPETKQSTLIDDILTTFWNYNNSPYVKSLQINGSSISVSYCKTMESRIRLYWLPSLKGRTIGSITTDDLRNIISNKKIQTLAPKTINGIADAITIPMKWAYIEKYTENVCFEGLRRRSVKSKERKVLTMEQAEEVMSADWENDEAKLANKVAMHTGMRAGEIAGLQLKNIQKDGIHVNQSWSKYVGLKCCKNGEARDIPIPISKELYDELMIQAKLNPFSEGEESFVFFGLKPKQPTDPKQWNKYLHRALKKIGYPKPEEICFHSWRHFFCSRMLDIIHDKRIVMALSGHKTEAMLDHYGKHLEDEKTLKIANEAIEEVFSSENPDNDPSPNVLKMVVNG